jgi:lipoyl(octanoyl) transferase
MDDPALRAGPVNMAIDEVLLQTTTTALLRFYRWNEPSVSFGYFGKFHEAEEFALARRIVRRWTGGGIVPHGEDLTYSLIIAASDPAFQLSSSAIYRAVHEIIAQSLRLMGIQTALAGQTVPKKSDSCFVNPVMADVLEAGRKIAGAAHRRTRLGLLHQGSIQRDGLHEHFRESMAAMLSEKIESEELNPAALKTSERLAVEKYGSGAWLRRR